MNCLIKPILQIRWVEFYFLAQGNAHKILKEKQAIKPIKLHIQYDQDFL